MKRVVVDKFGDPDVMQIRDLETPQPGPGEVRVAITSIGMNHADLMARKGEYLIASGQPPFTPGIEAGGVIDAVGAGVTDRRVGQRVILGADVPRRTPESGSTGFHGGTYATHYVTRADRTVLAPSAIPDDQLGAIWLPYLTAWGCLVWQQNLRPGQFVAIPAASSSVGLAAAQIVKERGAVAVGLTTSAAKVEQLKSLAESAFDHYVVTHNPDGELRSWHRDLRLLTQRRGVDVFFDPVAAGKYLQMEITALADKGTIWIYGLLGEIGPLDVTPLIRKSAAIRGWYLHELTDAGPAELMRGYDYILKGFEKGVFRQRVARTFTLDEVKVAHEEMQRGRHIGKLVLVPNSR